MLAGELPCMRLAKSSWWQCPLAQSAAFEPDAAQNRTDLGDPECWPTSPSAEAKVHPLQICLACADGQAGQTSL